jgi:hypothetical protein
MDRAIENPTPLTADEIADLADKGEDVSAYFTNSGTMMPPLHTPNAELGLLPPKDRHGNEV